METLILNEFYNVVLPQIKSNNLSIDGWGFNLEFQTIINDENEFVNKYNYINYNVDETLIINNTKIFDDLLVKYTIKMYELITSSEKLKKLENVYYNGNQKYIIDFIVSTLWTNETEDDFKNPINYIQNRINFLDNNLSEYDNVTYLENIDFFENASVKININLNNPILETPYSFKPSIVSVDNESTFELPSIFFGISDNICYIYTIQGKKIDKTELNSYQKKIIRILYKVNKSVEDDYEFENIKDVSPSALVSLTLFFKVLRENNIYDIRVVDYLPLRYKAKEEANRKKLEYLKRKIKDEDKLAETKRKFEEEQINIQYNVTNKFIRNFFRLENQLQSLEITNYPGELDINMRIKLNNNISNKDDILNLLSNMESNNSNIKRI